MLVCGLLWFAGCEQPGPLSADPLIATRQVSRLVPNGTSETVAKKTLAARGFKFSQMPRAGGDHLLLATFFQAKDTWVVGLVVVDGRVAASTVTITKDP